VSSENIRLINNLLTDSFGARSFSDSLTSHPSTASFPVGSMRWESIASLNYKGPEEKVSEKLLNFYTPAETGSEII
jgi:hypothetical protein